MVAAQIGFIQNIGGAEVLLIAIVALVVLGPERLPELARSAGRMVHKLKTMTDGLQSEVRDVMDDPSMQPIKELSEFAARPRQKLTQYALEAEAEERARQESERAAAAAAASAAAVASDEPVASDDGAPTDHAAPADDSAATDEPAASAPPDEPGAT